MINKQNLLGDIFSKFILAKWIYLEGIFSKFFLAKRSYLQGIFSKFILAMFGSNVSDKYASVITKSLGL